MTNNLKNLVELAKKQGFNSEKNDPNKEEKEYGWLMELSDFINEKYNIKIIEICIKPNDRYFPIIMKGSQEITEDLISLSMDFEDKEEMLIYILYAMIMHSEYTDPDSLESIRIDAGTNTIWRSATRDGDFIVGYDPVLDTEAALSFPDNTRYTRSTVIAADIEHGRLNPALYQAVTDWTTQELENLLNARAAELESLRQVASTAEIDDVRTYMNISTNRVSNNEE